MVTFFLFSYLLLSASPVLYNMWNTPVYKNLEKGASRHEFFSPYIIGDNIMQGSSDGQLLFIDKKNGSILRKESGMGGFERTPYFRRGIFYFATNDGKVFAYSYRANSILWTYKLGFPANSTPDICKDVLTFTASDNALYALDSKTGKELWVKKQDFPLKKPVIRGSSSPVCNLSTVYAGFSDGMLFGLNIFDGAKVFEKKLNPDTAKFKDVDATTLFYLGNIIIPSFDGALYSVNATSGKTNWSINDGSVKEPLLVGSSLYYSSNEGYLYHIDVNDGSLKWKVKLFKDGIGTKPAIYGNYLIIGNSNRGIQIYSKEDGSYLNEFNSAKGVFADPVVEDDMIYFYSNNAILYAFKIK